DACGVAALLLAVTGIYAVIAYTISQRAREIGIRVALGARPPHITALVMGAGARAVGVGLLSGAAAAAAGGRLIPTLLFGLSPGDPLTFTQVVVAVAGASLIACAVPAIRA